jgi:hypothetical protein
MNATISQTMTTAEARNEMLAAIGRAEAAGIDGATLDRMRLACEFFTNPEFKAAMADHVFSLAK